MLPILHNANLCRVEFGDAIVRDKRNGRIFRQTVSHVVSVFTGVVVVLAKDGHGAESVVRKEQLSRHVGLTYFQYDFSTTLL